MTHLDTAHQYWDWGANVNAISRGDKKPINTWKERDAGRQQLTELESYPWDAAGGVGIANGPGGWHTFDIDPQKDKQGKPIAVVGDAPIDALLEALRLPHDYAWVWRGRSKAGWALSFLCDDALPAGVLPAKKKEAGVAWGWPDRDSGAEWDHLELRYVSCQTVYPPSAGYQWRYEAPTEPPAAVPIHRVIEAFFTLCPPQPHTLGSIDRATVEQIKARFDLLQYAAHQFGGETQRESSGEMRILGHGGLLINEDKGIWHCFGDEIGGDCFDLIAYARYRTTARNLNGKSAEVLAEAAEIAGVRLPDRKPEQALREEPPKEADATLTPSQRIIAWLRKQGYTFRLNALDDSIEVGGHRLTDVIRAQIHERAFDDDIRPRSLIDIAYTAEAARNTYHPIRDYLDALKWDGKDHIGALARHITCPDPPITYDDGRTVPLHAVYLRRWLVGAVAKVFAHAQNVMLVPVGRQDIGKSALAKWLCSGIPDLFVEGSIHTEDKDCAIRLMSKFVWEVDELDGTTRKADVAALKGFITHGEITVRKPYGRHDIVKPATASLIGTVNDGVGFLNDETGSRRFLVFRVEALDWNYTKLDPNQLWAQAVALYRAGEPWRLLPCEAEASNAQNQQFSVDDLLNGWLGKYFDFTDDLAYAVSAADVIDHLQQQDVRLSGSTEAQAQAIGRAMRRRNVPWRHTRNGRRYYGVVPRDSANTRPDDNPSPTLHSTLHTNGTHQNADGEGCEGSDGFSSIEYTHSTTGAVRPDVHPHARELSSSVANNSSHPSHPSQQQQDALNGGEGLREGLREGLAPARPHGAVPLVDLPADLPDAARPVASERDRALADAAWDLLSQEHVDSARRKAAFIACAELRQQVLDDINQTVAHWEAARAAQVEPA